MNEMRLRAAVCAPTISFFFSALSTALSLESAEFAFGPLLNTVLTSDVRLARVVQVPGATLERPLLLGVSALGEVERSLLSPQDVTTNAMPTAAASESK